MRKGTRIDIIIDGVVYEGRYVKDLDDTYSRVAVADIILDLPTTYIHEGPLPPLFPWPWELKAALAALIGLLCILLFFLRKGIL